MYRDFSFYVRDTCLMILFLTLSVIFLAGMHQQENVMRKVTNVVMSFSKARRFIDKLLLLLPLYIKIIWCEVGYSKKHHHCCLI